MPKEFYSRKGRKAMKKELERALEQARQGQARETAEIVERIKALPRDEDGVFDLSSMEEEQGVKRILYPVYAAYETECNKKEGYPDILCQMRVMDARLQEHYDMQGAAVYMDMALGTLAYIDQQIYEYYRELMDLYKKNVRRFIQEFYGEGGPGAGEEPAVEAWAMFRENVRRACGEHILLEDKYGIYC